MSEIASTPPVPETPESIQAASDDNVPAGPTFDIPPTIHPLAMLILSGTLLLAVPVGIVYGFVSWLLPFIIIGLMISFFTAMGVAMLIVYSVWHLARVRSRVLMGMTALAFSCVMAYFSCSAALYSTAVWAHGGIDPEFSVVDACNPLYMARYTYFQVTATTFGKVGIDGPEREPTVVDNIFAGLLMLANLAIIGLFPAFFATTCNPDNMFPTPQEGTVSPEGEVSPEGTLPPKESETPQDAGEAVSPEPATDKLREDSSAMPQTPEADGTTTNP